MHVLAVLSFAAITMFAAPPSANATAAPAATADSTAVTDEGYAPRTPSEPTLAGSVVSPQCIADVPWIDYDIVLTDPDARSTGDKARLVMTDGVESVTIPLGTVAPDAALRGRVLWPGAAVDSAGNGAGWPGWVLQDDGVWAETDGNFAWTRGAITATVEVNPTLGVSLSYPPSTPACATDPVQAVPATAGVAAAADVDAVGLADTGGSAAPLALLAGAAATLALAGAGLVIGRARHGR